MSREEDRMEYREAPVICRASGGDQISTYVRSLRVDIYSRRRGQRPGSSGVNRQGFLQGLVGGEQESVDRIFTGQISGFLNGNLAGTQNNNIQYGFESSCPEGLDQNTALLATAAAIGNQMQVCSQSLH